MRHRVVIVIVVLAVALMASLWWSLSDDPAMAPHSETVTAAAAERRVTASGAVPALQPAALRSPAEATGDPAAPVVVPPNELEELWGRVLIAGTAQPIANAAVQLQHCDADEFWNLDLPYGQQVATLLSATTGADGRFRFPVARARNHRLLVRASGYAPATVRDCIGGSELVVGLSPGATIEGIVRCNGTGIADVAVRVVVEGQGTELAAGRTEPGGVFRFTGLSPSTVFVQASSSQHSEVWKRLELKDGAVHRAEIDLKVGVTLRGRVVEATTRTPIVDAELSDSWVFRRIVRTGTDGRFVLPGLADDSFVDVHVRAPGYAAASQNFAGQLGKEAEFALVRGGEVTGRFVTAAGVATAAVYAAVGASYEEGPGMQGTDSIRAEVGADGRFVVLGLRPDQHYWLYVRGAGFGARVYALARRLPSGERLDVGDVVLRAAGGIEGRVSDDSGQPIAGIGVSISGTNDDSRAWLATGLRPQPVSQFESRSIKTDAGGWFRLTHLAAGQHTLSVRSRGQRQAVSVVASVRDGAITEGLEIVIPTGAVIEGVLRYADGRTLGDEAAELYLSAAKDRQQDSSARPEVGGRFRFSGLPEGEYTLSILRGPPGWSLSPRPGVRTGTKDLELVLERSSFVSGRVVDAEGKGTKAQVYARAEGVTSGSALHATDGDGNFRIEVPPDFRGQVGAHEVRDWSLSASVDGVVAGQHELLLPLKATLGFGRRK